jgi:diguanylate cyclase (GGDEF)-like protein
MIAESSTMSDPLRILTVGWPAPDLAASPWGPFAVAGCASLAEAAMALRDQAPDAVLLHLPGPAEAERLSEWPALSHAVLDAAVVVVVSADPAPGAAVGWLQLGVQDVLARVDASGERLARVLRLAVERKRIDRAARKAFATDLATGLPNHAQLLEHLTHLFALREREPAPMALIALRMEGLAATADAFGPEAANVLRRKVAVRLRAGLRASDVVAAVGADTFVVLLAWIDAPDDGQRVAAKLAVTLRRPFAVAGRERSVAVSVGIALYPAQGKEPEALLRRALAQAASVVATGSAPGGQAVERGRSAAANDEAPPG